MGGFLQKQEHIRHIYNQKEDFSFFVVHLRGVSSHWNRLSIFGVDGTLGFFFSSTFITGVVVIVFGMHDGAT